MRIEIRSITSFKLIPENDSDRAVLQAFADARLDQSNELSIQSTTWCLGLQEMCIGYNKVNDEPKATAADAIESHTSMCS